MLRRDVKLPDFRDFAVPGPDEQKGKILSENTLRLGELLPDLLRNNMTLLRLLRPDATVSKATTLSEVAGRWKCDDLELD
jgi:phosphoketolase